jgi:hypothetical protein
MQRPRHGNATAYHANCAAIRFQRSPHLLPKQIDKAPDYTSDHYQAQKTNYPSDESIARACAGGNIDRDSLDRQFLFAVNDLISAFRFALEGTSRHGVSVRRAFCPGADRISMPIRRDGLTIDFI